MYNDCRNVKMLVYMFFTMSWLAYCKALGVLGLAVCSAVNRVNRRVCRVNIVDFRLGMDVSTYELTLTITAWARSETALREFEQTLTTEIEKACVREGMRILERWGSPPTRLGTGLTATYRFKIQA